MRAFITPVLATTALVAAVLAPRVFAKAAPETPPVADPVAGPSAPVAPIPSDDGGPAVTVTLDRDAVLAGGIVRAELTLHTPKGDAASVAVPSDVVLVIDTSGSMSGGKLDDAKHAARTLLAQLGSDDRVALVSFDAHARLVQGLSPAGSGMEATVDALGLGGSTNMAHGMEVALAALQEPVPGRARRVVLLSDGRPDDARPLMGLAQRFATAESPLTTVGIGADYDPLLMQQLADQGTGNFYWAGAGVPLDAIFSDEFRSARETVAQATRLSARTSEGVAMTGVSGFQVHQGSVALGDLFSGQRRTLYVDLQVPQTQGSLDLGALQLSWTTPDGTHVSRQVALGTVEVTHDTIQVAQSLDGDTWARSVVQEEYNALRTKVSMALSNGDTQQASQLVDGYVARNAMLNEVVGSAAVVDNLQQAEQLQQKIDSGNMNKEAFIDLATQAYQTRRSGQAKGY